MEMDLTILRPGGRLITLRQFSPGEAIIRENEPSDTAFIIERGKVEVARHSGGKPVRLAVLEAGSAFGEMSMVDDSSRSATVTAMEETVVREIHRDHLLAAMRENPDSIILLLKNIFERLREANMRLALLEGPLGLESLSAPLPDLPGIRLTSRPEAAFKPAIADPAGTELSAKPALYSIEGLTPRAVEALSGHPFRFSAFPLKIGRKTNDPLVSNQLEISDQDPLQISRHHVSLIRESGKVGVVDRGSHLGASVDGVRVGGKHHRPGPVFFKGDDGILVLGTDASPYRYRIRLES